MASMKDYDAFSSASVRVIEQAAHHLGEFGEARLGPLPGQPSSGTIPDLFFTPRSGPFANRTLLVEYKTTFVGRFLSSADAASVASRLNVSSKAQEHVYCVVITNSEIGAGARRVLDDYKVRAVASIDSP